jgi:hypothetical protein
VTGDGACKNCPDNSGGMGTGPASEEGCQCGPGFTRSPLSSQCVQCAAGQTKDSLGSAACTACATGEYVPAAMQGAGACLIAVPGYMALPNGSGTHQCNAGTFAATAGSSNCSHCEMGEYSSAGATACTSCPTGTAHALSQQTSVTACVPCKAGHFAAQSKSSSCVSCAQGQISMNGSALCFACPAGFHTSSDQGTCDPCLPGTWSGPGESLCLACAAGMHSFSGATACQCERGCFVEAGGASCSLCPPNHWKADTGNHPCTPCPVLSKTSASGSIAASDCLCSAGSFGIVTESSISLTSCQSCPTGTYKSTVGREVCDACPDGAPFSPKGSITEDKCTGLCTTLELSSCHQHATCAKFDHGAECSCGPGYEGDGISCTRCSKDTYKDSTGSDTCTSCGTNSCS